MKKKLTELVFILDRSGSMAGLEGDTIGGFNAMIAKQKTESSATLINTVLFDNISEVIHDRVSLENIQPLTQKEYYVRGCTALLDAIGGAIRHISTIHKYAREEDVPEHTLFVITTDGMENASREYSFDKVKQMIQEQKDKYGWEFIFLGANIDAVETARHIGIRPEMAVTYHSDHKGTQLNYEALSETLCAFRQGAPAAVAWHEAKCAIEEDFQNRRMMVVVSKRLLPGRITMTNIPDYVLRQKAEAEVYKDSIRGCLFGGAVGDALGYPVEFFSFSDIYMDYSPLLLNKNLTVIAVRL